MISQINVFMAMSVLINSTTVDVLVQFMTKEEFWTFKINKLQKLHEE
jgi:hypothetical protein